MNPLDLVEADVSMAPGIQMRGVPRRVIGHCRGVLERVTVFQTGGDARGAQRLLADRRANARRRTIAYAFAFGSGVVLRFPVPRAIVRTSGPFVSVPMPVPSRYAFKFASSGW
ncbi:hypothetical protein [Paraburkholderia terrae]|uniref:hypothetical protein n=1 Tax=Paraburkholderia terrae TaxID=311230 RepID=UPI001319E425